jgi:hypothetical protein
MEQVASIYKKDYLEEAVDFAEMYDEESTDAPAVGARLMARFHEIVYEAIVAQIRAEHRSKKVDDLLRGTEI